VTDSRNNALTVSGFQAKKSFWLLFVIQIEQHRTSSNFTVVIEKSTFFHNRVVLIQCQDCNGHNNVVINNCTFQAKQSALFHNDTDESPFVEIKDQLNGSDAQVLHNNFNWEQKFYATSIIYGFYVGCKNGILPHRILIINSMFSNYSETKCMLQFILEISSKGILMICQLL